jgi:hypothetical protein
MKKTLLAFITLIISITTTAQPPYSGTIFIDPDIITSTDPSAIQSTTYTGQGTVTMYDRRVSDWVTVNAYLFDVVWDDGLTSVAEVNPEFGSIAAATTEAEKYAFLIGQLPACLRSEINEIWIHKGQEPFGGGNNSILIHTDQSTDYENNGIIEETLVHEACHTSLDATHANNPDWINAQNLDGTFISTYAQNNPAREDVAESFLPWLAVRYRQSRISASDYNTITSTIPNRLAYFDAINCDLYPFVPTQNIEKHDNQIIKLYPNPTSELIHINAKEIHRNDIRIYNLLGQDFTHQISYIDNILNVSKLPKGFYILKINSFVDKIYKK